MLIKRQEKIEQKRDIYEKYAQPLGADAANLLWRLNEIFFDQRSHYLREDAPPTPFNEYKVISTCYRIAVLLGWIRAIRLEQSYLLFGDSATFGKIRDAVCRLEIALADSPPVEIEAMESLARIWSIDLPNDLECAKRIAAQVNAELQHFFSEFALTSYQQFVQLGELKGREVARRAADAMTRMVGVQSLADARLLETYDEALRCISVKRAWIYREWQQAIGNLMIRQIDGAVRRFDIIGYSEFEAMVRDPKSNKSDLLMRLRDMIVGIDLNQPVSTDYRIKQLRLVANAVASLVCAIETLKLKRKIVDKVTCDMARKFLREIPENAPAA
jgi:hypothetical protein